MGQAYKQNEIENNTVLYKGNVLYVNPLNAVRQVRFFNVNIENFVGGNISHFRCLACWVVVFDYKVGNSRNDHFRYFLGVRVRLIEMSAS